ncbi:N-methyl-L-tryptophan oxidase [Cryptosporangium aurantiacum]|uniref:Sarcosine oxidase, monomeric form n=1 Tax=Cryptosporangium aurantiacum TaxID=134849 RepID=A0A1M7RHT5_9ACTN|nr:N-methyl-L-tryptophan oxidase [Cryptosporangium aurantiacum]SHN45824.1 sarcosine oxidase, monomeric form [Cryptosporangium aurantiacum]
MNSYDVIVLGLGGMGSAAAHHLAARGQRVLGLEQFGPAHALGSSHGGSRIIRQSYFEDPAYVPLLVRAYELWEDLEAASGADLLTLTGGLYVGPAESTTVAGSLAAAREWNLPHELLDAETIRVRFPTTAPDEDVVGLYEERAGFVRPEASVAAHLSVAGRLGADLHFEEPVLDWSAHSGGVAVTTARGTYTAGTLVISPGAWAPRVLASLGLPLRVERQVMYWFQPVGGVEPYLPDRHPIYVWEDRTGVQTYGFPSIDGPEGGVKIAFFRKGIDTTPDTLDREVHDDEITAMAERAGRDLPTLPGRFLRGAACMYTTTPDEHFVIAPHPEHERVVIACGFSGHGFKFVPVVGEILADLATDGTTRHPIALFDPARSSAAGSRT